MSNRSHLRLVLVLIALMVVMAAMAFGYARRATSRLEERFQEQAHTLQQQGFTVHYTALRSHSVWRPGLTLSAPLIVDSRGNGWSAARLDLSMSWLSPRRLIFHSVGTQRLRLAGSGLLRMEHASGTFDTRSLHLTIATPRLVASHDDATPIFAVSNLRADIRLFPRAGADETHWIMTLDAKAAQLPDLTAFQTWQPRHVHMLLVGLNDALETLRATQTAAAARILLQKAECETGPLHLSAAGSLSAQGNGTLGLHASNIHAALRHFLAHPPAQLENPDAMALWNRLSAHDLDALPDALDLPLPLNAWQPVTATPLFLQIFEQFRNFQNEMKP